MLGAFIRADGKFGGLHFTWLSVGTSPGDVIKAEIIDPAEGEMLNPKKMRGSKTGAHIAIASPIEPKRLIIGEGIETALAVWTAHHADGRDLSDTAFWAAGDLGNLAGRAARTIPHPTLKRPEAARRPCPSLSGSG